MSNPNSPQLSSFTFEDENIVRSFLDDKGEPWFLAADICRILDLDNTSRALARLDEDEKGVTTSNTPGGQQQMATVNESGLYSLILTSRKPEAKRFKKWITSEVLPAIRKTGSYSVPNLSPAELILVQAQRLVAHERQLMNHDQRLGSLEARVNARDEWSQHYTVIGYCNLRRLKPPSPNQATSWGKRAAALSRQREIAIGKTSDPRFGEVGTYHISILEEVIGTGKAD
jgi:prophage antirepressor-like protein